LDRESDRPAACRWCTPAAAGLLFLLLLGGSVWSIHHSASQSAQQQIKEGVLAEATSFQDWVDSSVPYVLLLTCLVFLVAMMWRGIGALRTKRMQRRLAEEARQHIEEITALNVLHDYVAGNLPLDQMIRASLEGIFAAASPDLALFFQRDGNNIFLKGFHARASEFEHQAMPVHRLGECLCGLCVAQAKPVYSRNIHHDPRCSWDECKQVGLVSFAALPLLSGPNVIGSLGLASHVERDFSKQAQFLETLARAVAASLQNSLFYEETKRNAVVLASMNVNLTSEINERESVERELIRAKGEWEETFHAIGHPTMILDTDHTIVAVNQATLETIGVPKDDLLGKKCYDVFHGPDAEEPIEGCPMQRMLESGCAEVSDVEFQGLGSLCAISCAPVFDKQGNLDKAIHIATDITEHKRAEETMAASLEEKVRLLREVHHRARNNMQIISSLLRMQSRHFDNKLMLAAFEESQQRIQAMALVHELLYRSETLSSIAFDDYAQRLANHLAQVYNIHQSGIECCIVADAVTLSIEKAISAALVLHELLSNAFQHAFPHPQGGKVTVSIEQAFEQQIGITVSDNGIGLPKDFDLAQCNRLGLQLVRDLVEGQLGGSITIGQKNGTQFSIRFDCS